MKTPLLQVCTLLALLSMTGCDKRAAIRTQIEVVQAEIVAKQSQDTNLQNELKAMPNLGKYNIVGPNLIQGLRSEIEKSEAAIAKLKSEKTAAEAVNQKLREDRDSYLTKHSKH